VRVNGTLAPEFTVRVNGEIEPLPTAEAVMVKDGSVVVVVVGGEWQVLQPALRVECFATSPEWQPSHASAVDFIAGAVVWQVLQAIAMVVRW